MQFEVQQGSSILHWIGLSFQFLEFGACILLMLLVVFVRAMRSCFAAIHVYYSKELISVWWPPKNQFGTHPQAFSAAFIPSSMAAITRLTRLNLSANASMLHRIWISRRARCLQACQRAARRVGTERNWRSCSLCPQMNGIRRVETCAVDLTST